MHQRHVYHADYLELRAPCGTEFGPGESLTGHRPEVNCGACRAVLVARGYVRPEAFFGGAVSPKLTRNNVVTPEQLAYATERVRWGALGDLQRLQHLHHLLPAALAAAAAAEQLTAERSAELATSLAHERATRTSGYLLADLPVTAEVSEGAAAARTSVVHSDHPLPVRREAKVDAKGGEMVTFFYA